jgi:hypothetical protein
MSSSWSVPATVSHAAGALGGLLRRFSTDPPQGPGGNGDTSPSFGGLRGNGTNGVYTPPYRTASPVCMLSILLWVCFVWDFSLGSLESVEAH